MSRYSILKKFFGDSNYRIWTFRFDLILLCVKIDRVEEMRLEGFFFSPDVKSKKAVFANQPLF